MDPFLVPVSGRLRAKKVRLEVVEDKDEAEMEEDEVTVSESFLFLFCLLGWAGG